LGKVEIEMRRSKSIGAIVAGLHDLLDRYRSSDYVCPSGKVWAFECGSILYGALTKGMHSMGVWSPFPIEPFAGLSLHHVATKAKLMKSPAWLPSNSTFDQRNFNQNDFKQIGKNHSCSLGLPVSEMVNRVWVEATGLDLQEYQEKEKKN
jgi:hypothetical protein